jgi:hypothetical protein
LCVRLRQKDWKIFRLDAEMTLHWCPDASILANGGSGHLRAGHAYVEGASTVMDVKMALAKGKSHYFRCCILPVKLG